MPAYVRREMGYYYVYPVMCSQLIRREYDCGTVLWEDSDVLKGPAHPSLPWFALRVKLGRGSAFVLGFPRKAGNCSFRSVGYRLQRFLPFNISNTHAKRGKGKTTRAVNNTVHQIRLRCSFKRPLPPDQ